jgi:hypothetical protein
VGRRLVARGCVGGGERIPATRQSRGRLTAAFASLALAAAIVIYSTSAGERLPDVIAGVGAGGCALIVVAFLIRRAAVFPVGLAGVGAAYGVFVSLRAEGVDPRAPFVAATFFVAAELGYAALDRGIAHSERAVVVRRAAALALAALASGLVGSLLLVATTGVGGSVALEAVGVAAATLTLAAIMVLASRSSV